MLTGLAASLLAAQAAPEIASWRLVAVTGPPGAQTAHFADRTNIRRNGSIVWIDEARETERPDADGIFSHRARMEYDCRARVARLLAVRFLDADGTVIVVSDPSEHLSPVLMDSPEEVRLRFACRETRGLGTVRDDLRATALRLFDNRARLFRAYPRRDPATPQR